MGTRASVRLHQVRYVKHSVLSGLIGLFSSIIGVRVCGVQFNVLANHQRYSPTRDMGEKFPHFIFSIASSK